IDADVLANQNNGSKSSTFGFTLCSDSFSSLSGDQTELCRVKQFVPAESLKSIVASDIQSTDPSILSSFSFPLISSNTQNSSSLPHLEANALSNSSLSASNLKRPNDSHVLGTIPIDSHISTASVVTTTTATKDNKDNGNGNIIIDRSQRSTVLFSPNTCAITTTCNTSKMVTISSPNIGSRSSIHIRDRICDRNFPFSSSNVNLSCSDVRRPFNSGYHGDISLSSFDITHHPYYPFYQYGRWPDYQTLTNLTFPQSFQNVSGTFTQSPAFHQSFPCGVPFPPSNIYYQGSYQPCTHSYTESYNFTDEPYSRTRDASSFRH
ncbi:unnamed protein product, partial [Protopolystoma xenopodis]